MNNANGGNILFHFKGDASQLNKTTSSLGGMTKSILVATGVTKALSTAWNMVASSTDSAIERYDQLNAFPKVMSSLGIETSKSEKAVRELAEGLKGLPTTLNQGTTAVSRFVAKNEDIEKSTKMFLAVNDAIISGNAPIVNQEAALEQLTQAYSRGKPELNEWKSLMVAMPGQMKQVAKAMGYLNTDELYNDLRDGKISMDDFIDTIIRLDQEGSDGLESFNKQAKNATGGIKTSIVNMKTAVSRGVADMITSLDNTLKKSNVKGGISGIITKIGEGFEKGLKETTENLTPLIESLISGENIVPNSQALTEKIFDGVSQAIQFVNDNIPEIIFKFGDLVEGISRGIQDALPKIAEKLTGLLDTINKELEKEENKQKMADVGSNLIDAFLKGMVSFIENNGVQLLTSALDNLLDLPYDVARRMIINFAGGILEMAGVPKKEINKIKDTIISIIEAIPEKMRELGKMLVDGLVKGIRGAIPSLTSASNEIANIAAKVVKAKNKIHSPSKLFEYYGEMIDEGYIKGIEGMKGALQKATMDTFVMTPQLIGTASTNFSPVVNVNNQITNNTDPLGQTVSQIKTFANGSKNDYNYGMGV